MRKGIITTVMGAVLALFVAGAAFAQTVTIGQIQSNPNAFLERVVTLSGTVTPIDENEFILSDGTGQIQLDAGPPWFQSVNLNPGESVTVTGEIDTMRGGGVDLDACKIVRADGSTVDIRDCAFDGPPPWTGGPNRGGRDE
jgi:uncharacterized protein YdeI (BOF family)